MLSKEQKALLLPTNDLIFKEIYGKEGNEQITEAFIKAFLDLDIKIDKLEASEPLDIDNIDDKAGILDILVTTKGGTKINLEMQVGTYEGIEEKFCFYGLELFVKSVKKGMQYKEVDKTMAIMILKEDYVKYNNFEEYKLTWHLREEKYHDLILTDKLELCIISLEKIRKKIANGEISDKEKIAIWTKFLLTPKELKEEEMNENKEVKEANEKYNEMLEDEQKSLLAFKRHLDQMERNSLLNNGVQKGKKEVAKKMLIKNKPIEEIIEFTGLTKEEIENLK